jgi:hypothetical protein
MQPIFPPEHQKNEIRALLICARTHIDTTQTSVLRQLLSGALNWAWLLEYGKQHELLPLLYWNLNSTCPDLVPAMILGRLQLNFQNTAQHNRGRIAALLKALETLERHGIQAIPMKGPILAMSIYSSPGLRIFGDLDVFISEENIGKSLTVMGELGYIRKPGGRYQRSVIHPEHQTTFELHYGFTAQKGYALQYERFRKRLVPMTIQEQTIHIFDPVDTLLHLCMHGSKHLWHPIKWLSDIDGMLRTYEPLDWQYVLQQAAEMKVQRSLLLGLGLAHDLLETPVPAQILDKLATIPPLKRTCDQLRTAALFPKLIPPIESSAHTSLMDSVVDRQIRPIHSLLKHTVPVDVQRAYTRFQRRLRALRYPRALLRRKIAKLLFRS